MQVEEALREWLRAYYGVIGRAEALRLGASPELVDAKLRRGEWIRMYPGVYRNAATPRTPYQDLRAACVATQGVASHASAAWVWGLLAQPPPLPEVTIPCSQWDARGQTSFVIHRSRDLQRHDGTTTRAAIPVTKPLRTLVDLAGTAPPGQLTEAVDNALARRLLTMKGLEAEIERLSGRGRKGIGFLRRHLLEQGFIGAPEPSVLEAHLRRLVLSLDIPLPTPELHVGKEGQYRIDLPWKAILFAVEVDGYAWHFSPAHKRRDENRRNALRLEGWTLLVYDWRDILGESPRVGREIITMFNRLSRCR